MLHAEVQHPRLEPSLTPCRREQCQKEIPKVKPLCPELLVKVVLVGQHTFLEEDPWPGGPEGLGSCSPKR